MESNPFLLLIIFSGFILIATVLYITRIRNKATISESDVATAKRDTSPQQDPSKELTRIKLIDSTDDITADITPDINPDWIHGSGVYLPPGINDKINNLLGPVKPMLQNMVKVSGKKYIMRFSPKVMSALAKQEASVIKATGGGLRAIAQGKDGRGLVCCP